MRIGIWQTEGLIGNPRHNIARLVETLTAAQAQGVELLVCPELWTTGYNDPAAVAEYAEAPDGPTFQTLSDLACAFGMAIAYGYPERSADAGALYNSAQLVGADGARLLNYRKLNLWGAAEKALFRPGEARAAPVDYRGWRIGFSICYDTEFPETIRWLAEAGADLVLAPTALSDAAPQVAALIAPTRALENGVYLAFANRSGTEHDLTYLGQSCLAGPDGAKLAAAAASETLIVADLDRGRLEQARARNPYRVDLRRDLDGPSSAASSNRS